jgi:glycosyltransferase 2 family protein
VVARAAVIIPARLERALPALRVAGFGLGVALVATMGVLAVREVPPRSVTWWPVAPAVAAAVVWWVLLARGWAILVQGRATPSVVGMWCRTQVLRYLPGGVWAPASRVVLVDGSPVDRVATVAAENIVSLCAALAIGGAALAAGGRPAYAPLALLALVPATTARLAPRRTRLAPGRVVRATANGLAGFACYAACAVLVQAAVTGLQHPLLVAGAAGVSWAAGLVVVFAPGGVGVRELAYVGLLAGTFGRADLVAAAVIMRAVTIAAELLVLLAFGRPRGREGSRSSLEGSRSARPGAAGIGLRTHKVRRS